MDLCRGLWPPYARIDRVAPVDELIRSKPIGFDRVTSTLQDCRPDSADTVQQVIA